MVFGFITYLLNLLLYVDVFDYKGGEIMCRISVIMGIYNIEKQSIFAEKAINSILNQTFRDFEFIICDDGSTDDTYNIVKKLTKNDKRVILLKNIINKGLAYSLNHCLKIAKGEYIARMDADDISLSSRFDEEVKFLDRNPEYSLVGCNLELINDKGVWGKRILVEKPDKYNCLFGPTFAHPTIMIRKKVIDALNGYKVEKITLRAEDYDLYMRFFAAGYKGYNIQKYLFRYREDNNTYKRWSKSRINEMKLRYRGFKQLGILFPRGWLYVLKPLITKFIPQRFLAKIRDYRNNKIN